MQIRAVIIARGEVQRVGYRDAVERAARKMRLTGFVENTKPYDVRIVCEGDKTSVDSFVKIIKIEEFPINVEHLDVSFEDATGEFDYFEIKRGDMTEELGERLDLARAEMTKMTQKQDVMIEKQDVMIEKQDVMIEKQDVMINKLDENTSILKDFKNESSINFKLLHSDNVELKEIMTKHDVDAQERITFLTKEISEIKKRLARVESAVL